MRILISGSHGLVGEALIKALEAGGHRDLSSRAACPKL